MSFDLRQELQRFGAMPDSVKLFDEANASVVRYIDLLPDSARRARSQTWPLPSAVIEHEGRPLLYVVRADSLTDTLTDESATVAGVLRSLACRGEGDYVGFIKPGEITVYPVALSKQVPHSLAVRTSDARAPLLIQDLSAGLGELDMTRAAGGEALHNLLFGLLSSVSDALRRSRAIKVSRTHDQVLPLVGRALFTRFLVDRGIINAETFPRLYEGENTPEKCYSTPELAARTCAWLDDKFNGELLPLFEPNHAGHKAYLTFFRDVHHKSSHVLHELSNVMYRAPGGQLSLELSWSGIDFAHVPVGLLSEVYEDYAHKFYKDDALRESVRFTPRHIAEFTVSHAFEGLPKEHRHQARLLDPAAGAGIFLVLSLQRLVRERWEATKHRPGTLEIREILYRQIRGFDINASALTLAALSLYLTALELDPDPYPPEKLRFERLLGNVLFNMRETTESYPSKHMVFGSLGPLGNTIKNIGQYDIVIGNPPWTAWKGADGKNFNAQMTVMVRDLLSARSGNDVELIRIAKNYEHNDMLPDVAFLWRAQQWAKPGGIISLIMHGRLIFKRAERGADVRNALFRSMHVTGILNGADLMKVWPSLNQPFCIVFGRNEVPKPSYRFRFVTPELDLGPGGQLRMRNDYESAQSIAASKMFSTPYLLKALSRGGRLDVGIIDRLYALTRPEPPDMPDEEDTTGETASKPDEPSVAQALRVGDIWSSGGLPSGQGFFPGAGSSAQHLLALKGKQLTADDNQGLHIDTAHLVPFTQKHLLRPRRTEIYKPPLVLISQGPGRDPRKTRARLHLGKVPLVYNFSFYGYSTHGHPQADMLARYLFVLANSDLFVYFMLMVSAKLGLERRTVYIEDIEDFPIIPIERLTMRQLGDLQSIADNLSLADPHSWRNLNRWVFDLYGFSPADEQVIADTLATRMPYAGETERALAPASPKEVETFRATLESQLRPFIESLGGNFEAHLAQLPVKTWIVVDLLSNDPGETRVTDLVTSLAAELAEHEGASRIIVNTGTDGHLRIAVRNQYRYLTKSRARLCALDVLRLHADVFPINAE